VDDGGARGFARLSEDVREALGGYAARASWPAGFTIYQRGAQADGLFIVIGGRVLLRSRVRVGRSFIPLIAVPGETFGSEGLGFGIPYATDARADDESETLFLSSVRLRAFIREQPQHTVGLIAQLMGERTGLLDRLHEITTLSVEQRIVATLLRLARTNTFTDGAGRIVLCTQRYRLLCELVGATRESVSLVLGRFTAQGLAEREGATTVLAPASELIRRVGAGVGERETAFGPFNEQPEQVVQ
jgi:CRP-like cAMP-binding protein